MTNYKKTEDVTKIPTGNHDRLNNIMMQLYVKVGL